MMQEIELYKFAKDIKEIVLSDDGVNSHHHLLSIVDKLNKLIDESDFVEDLNRMAEQVANADLRVLSRDEDNENLKHIIERQKLEIKRLKEK